MVRLKMKRLVLLSNNFFNLKPRMYSFMVDDNSKHKKAKDVDINAVATISYSEYKNVLLNKECLRHLMNRI